MLHWLTNSPAGFDVVLVAGFVFCAIIYMAPAVMAWSLRSKGLLWLTAVNILLGWTVIGWIVALVWAMAGAKDSSFNDIDNPTDTEVPTTDQS